MKKKRIVFAVTLLLVSAGQARAADVKALEAQISSVTTSVSNLNIGVATITTTLNQVSAKVTALTNLTNMAQSVLLVAGVAPAHQGQTVNVPISIVPSTWSVAGFQVDVGLPVGISFTSATAGPAATGAAKSVQAAAVVGGERILVSGLNQTVMGQGVAVVLQVLISTSALSGNYPLPLFNPVAADLNGMAPPVSGTSGMLLVR